MILPQFTAWSDIDKEGIPSSFYAESYFTLHSLNPDTADFADTILIQMNYKQYYTHSAIYYT